MSLSLTALADDPHNLIDARTRIRASFHLCWYSFAAVDKHVFERAGFEPYVKFQVGSSADLRAKSLTMLSRVAVSGAASHAVDRVTRGAPRRLTRRRQAGRRFNLRFRGAAANG